MHAFFKNTLTSIISNVKTASNQEKTREISLHILGGVNNMPECSASENQPPDE